MRSTRTTPTLSQALGIVSLTMALLVVATTTRPPSARAELRVGVAIQTPQLHVVASSRPLLRQPDRVVVRRAPARPLRSWAHLGREDRRMAFQLSRLSGASVTVLLELRSGGHSWAQVGHILKIHPRVLRQAQQLAAAPHPWKRRHGLEPRCKRGAGPVFLGHR